MIPRKATSSYTLDTIEKRLAELRGQQTEEAKREIEYLEDLKARKFAVPAK